jgi:hypothetical protein
MTPPRSWRRRLREPGWRRRQSAPATLARSAANAVIGEVVPRVGGDAGRQQAVVVLHVPAVPAVARVVSLVANRHIGPVWQ